jgi:hypothetical protein
MRCPTLSYPCCSKGCGYEGNSIAPLCGGRPLGFDRLFSLIDEALAMKRRGELPAVQHRTNRRKPVSDIFGFGLVHAHRGHDHGRTELADR